MLSRFTKVQEKMSFKRARCAHCRGKLVQERPSQIVHEGCAEGWALALIAKRDREEAKRVKAQQKAERDNIRERKQALKRIPELEEECRKIVQKIARIRDRNDGCISCELPANCDGQWHGSHFRSHGAASAVQFNLWNIHKACWICNKLYSGRIDQYEPKLVAKIGQEKVDWLKSQNQIVRHSREYLAKFKRVMGKRLRRMERLYRQTD